MTQEQIEAAIAALQSDSEFFMAAIKIFYDHMERYGQASLTFEELQAKIAAEASAEPAP